jgi:hypothetical protein
MATVSTPAVLGVKVPAAGELDRTPQPTTSSIEAKAIALDNLASTLDLPAGIRESLPFGTEDGNRDASLARRCA